MRRTVVKPLPGARRVFGAGDEPDKVWQTQTSLPQSSRDPINFRWSLCQAHSAGTGGGCPAVGPLSLVEKSIAAIRFGCHRLLELFLLLFFRSYT
jgi:hypothetical protein